MGFGQILSVRLRQILKVQRVFSTCICAAHEHKCSLKTDRNRSSIYSCSFCLSLLLLAPAEPHRQDKIPQDTFDQRFICIFPISMVPQFLSFKHNKPLNLNIFPAEGLMSKPRFAHCALFMRSKWPPDLWLRSYYPLVPSGSHIGGLRIHLFGGTCNAPWSFAKCHHCHSCFCESLGNPCPYLSPPYMPTDPVWKQRKEQKHHPFLSCCCILQGWASIFLWEGISAKSTLNTTYTGPDVKHICTKGRLDLKHQLSDMNIQLMAINGKNGHGDPNCTVDVKQICVHTQTKSWRVGRL